MTLSSLEEIRSTRLRKIEELRALGINPYPSRSGRTAMAGPIVEGFAEWEGREVTVAGRLMSFRKMGGLSFGHPHGLSNQELQDILDPWEEPTCSGPHLLPAEPTQDFPGETFRVLRNKQTAKYGEHRTRAAWCWKPGHDCRQSLDRHRRARPGIGGSDKRTSVKVDDELVLVPPGSRQQSLGFGTVDGHG